MSGTTTCGNGRPHTAGAAVPWDSRAAGFAAQLTPDLRRDLAESLGLPEAVLASLGVGYCPSGPHRDQYFAPCWTFPECDGMGDVIGITCRYRDGAKMAWPGGKRGV